MNRVDRWEDLETYQLAFALQQEVFELTRSWPREETYSLIDQIRRSSRSIGANIAESWAKRRYPAHFLSKLTDVDGETQEPLHWIATARASQYITNEQAESLRERQHICEAFPTPCPSSTPRHVAGHVLLNP